MYRYAFTFRSERDGAGCAHEVTVNAEHVSQEAAFREARCALFADSSHLVLLDPAIRYELAHVVEFTEALTTRGRSST